MKRRVIIFISCWCFAAGIAVASFLPRKFLLFDIYFFAIFAVLFLTAFFVAKKYRQIIFWSAFFFFGFWRLSVSFPADSPEKIWHYNGQNLEITGVAANEPVNKEKSQRLEIEVKNIVGIKRKISGRILVSAPIYPEYFYGDTLKFQCEIEAPGIIENFDYGRYLAAKNIYTVCYSPKDIEKQESKKSQTNLFGQFFWKKIFSLREKMRSTVELGLPEPQAGLVKAFILGDSTAVPDDLNDSFRQSGLSHIVAISGTHITLLVGMFFFLLLGINLNRRQAFYLSIPLIIFYILLAGSPASAVRSGVMGFLVLLGLHVGRLNRLDYSLVLSGAVMLLVNPKYLIADAGFQLSFLAVLSMAYLYPVFDKFLKKFYDKKFRPEFLQNTIKIICQAFALTIAAQVFTLPVLIFSFHQISLVAPFSNILVVWISPFLMGGAFAGIILSLIFPAAAPFWFLPAGIFAKYLIVVAEICAKLPLAYWKF